MTRQELVERILFAVDGYRLGEWSLSDAGARITKLIEQNPDAADKRIAERLDGGKLFDSMVELWDYHRMTFKEPSGRGCEGCKWTGGSSRDHHLHRLSLLADTKAATTRVQERLGGAK